LVHQSVEKTVYSGHTLSQSRFKKLSAATVLIYMKLFTSNIDQRLHSKRNVGYGKIKCTSKGEERNGS
jgi:hypothetical protein